MIDAGLPTDDEALIELHIDILGIVDFGAKTLSIDGGLYDSRILIYSLAGDLALRLSWGDNPNFVFSLGGFNPHFNTDGLNVPQMHRMSVSIGDGDNPCISANSYFAITSNTPAIWSECRGVRRGWRLQHSRIPWLRRPHYCFAILVRVRFLGGFRRSLTTAQPWLG